jgi:hypothetical protein
VGEPGPEHELRQKGWAPASHAALPTAICLQLAYRRHRWPVDCPFFILLQIQISRRVCGNNLGNKTKTGILCGLSGAESKSASSSKGPLGVEGMPRREVARTKIFGGIDPASRFPDKTQRSLPGNPPRECCRRALARPSKACHAFQLVSPW